MVKMENVGMTNPLTRGLQMADSDEEREGRGAREEEHHKEPPSLPVCLSRRACTHLQMGTLPFSGENSSFSLSENHPIPPKSGGKLLPRDSAASRCREEK